MKCLVLASAFLFTICLPIRAEDDAGARTEFDKLLAAVDAKDYDAFVADADDVLRGALTKTQFEAVSDMMTAHGSHEVTFLGELNKPDYEIYVYRVRYKDEDVLGTMALKDGKVAGIYFK